MLPVIAMAPMPVEFSIPVAIAEHVKVTNYDSMSFVAWGSITGSIHSELRSKESAILWSPISLLDGTTARRASSIEAIHALVVDVDHGETWDDVLCKLDALTWWAYTTHSHAAEEHRFRVVFPLARPVPAGQWKTAWAAGLQALGIHADKACNDPCRIYYLPSHAPGAPWDMLSNDGALLDLLGLLESLPAPVAPAASTPTAPRGPKPAGKGDYKTLDLAAWAATNGAKPQHEQGGEGKIFIECPWKSEHTGGLQGPKDTYLFDKGDGWPIFRCAHSHCRDRGTHSLLEMWPNADEHCAREYAPPTRLSPKPESPSDESTDDEEIRWPVCKEKTNPQTGVVTATIPGCEANAREWMTHTHAGKVAYNELTGELELSEEPVTDSVTSQLLIRLQTLTQSVFQLRHVEGAIRALIEDPRTRRYHPVREYLESLPPHDEDTPVIAGLIDAGIIQLQPEANEELCQEYLLRFFVGAVARQMEPGCKHDCALIFQGAQGLGKSTFFRAIVPVERWFSDSMGDLEEKDSRLILSRAWIFEWSELESVRRSNMGAVKAFLSAQDDDVRAPYARQSVHRRRTCVIVGSTNESQFIVDPTGSRRFWVVPVVSIDRAEVRRYRDQLWAEAIHIYRTQWADIAPESRPSLPPWALSSGAEAVQRLENESQTAADPWESAIDKWLPRNRRLLNQGYDGCETTVEEILYGCLEIPPSSQARTHQMRVGQILVNLGWERKRLMQSGSRQYVYRLDPESARKSAEPELVF